MGIIGAVSKMYTQQNKSEIRSLTKHLSNGGAINIRHDTTLGFEGVPLSHSRTGFPNRPTSWCSESGLHN